MNRKSREKLRLLIVGQEAWYRYTAQRQKALYEVAAREAARRWGPGEFRHGETVHPDHLSQNRFGVPYQGPLPNCPDECLAQAAHLRTEGTVLARQEAVALESHADRLVARWLVSPP